MTTPTTPAAAHHVGPDRPTCAGCGDPSRRGAGLFCTVCLTDIPVKVAKEVTDAQKALAARPTNPAAQQRLGDAMAAAAGYLR